LFCKRKNGKKESCDKGGCNEPKGIEIKERSVKKGFVLCRSLLAVYYIMQQYQPLTSLLFCSMNFTKQILIIVSTNTRAAALREQAYNYFKKNLDFSTNGFFKLKTFSIIVLSII